MSDKRIIVIAGPNGAGKTTFAGEFLPQEAQCPAFINADLIAAGLSPFSPDQAAFKAGRLMLQEMDEHAARGDNFAFETTYPDESMPVGCKRGNNRAIWFRSIFYVCSHPNWLWRVLPSVSGRVGTTYQSL